MTWLIEDEEFIQKVKGYTISGAPIGELGTGCSDGVCCGHCKGDGYIHGKVLGFAWRVCPICKGEYHINKLTCNKCNGSGKYKRYGKTIGGCFKCAGTGKYTLPNIVTCMNCTPSFRGGKISLVITTLRNLSLNDVVDEILYSRAYLRKQGHIPEILRELVTCCECGGAGEIALFNPVLKKSLVAAL